MIAGRLQAERAAWLALNRAARLERYRDGWLQRERQALADAQAQISGSSKPQVV